MPWSEWVQSDPYPYAPKMVDVEDNLRYNGVIQREAFDESSGPAILSTSRQNGPDPSTEEWTRTHHQFSAPDGWASKREWSPPELADLTYGTDYALRPDRTLSDPDRFIEYEGGVPNEAAGWMSYAAAMSVRTARATRNDQTTVDALWQVGVVEGTNYQAGPIGAIGYGGVFYTADPYVADGSPVPLPPVSDTTLSFLLWADMAYDIEEGALSIFEVDVPRLYFKVRLPRWRYWKPGGPIPLRQRQRDDGLALSAARWKRGGSRQVSNRWKGYL